jgi:hypothetical protein
MKRLSGPAFYVNTKYNQSMALANKQRDTRAQHVDYNKTHSWELFDVKEGELLVCKKRDRNRESFPRVISSVNGIDTDKGKDLLENYTFLGVAQTEHKAVKDPVVDQGLVACVGGLATIINDHNEHICPGQILYLQKPSVTATHMRGIPKDKKRFCLAPLSQTDQNELYKAKLQLLQLKNKQAILDLLRKRQYPVAKALSHAKPGQRLDILLHPRCPQQTFLLPTGEDDDEDMDMM